MISLAWEGDFPLGQPFGANPHLYQPHFPGHEGQDVLIPGGFYVRSLWNSVCVEVGLGSGSYGYYVKLREDGGEREILYCHLQAYRLPRPGEWVAAGERVGVTGNSGRVIGPNGGFHLHIGYRPRWWDRANAWDGFADPVPALT